jgi:hypothetical protein
MGFNCKKFEHVGFGKDDMHYDYFAANELKITNKYQTMFFSHPTFHPLLAKHKKW